MNNDQLLFDQFLSRHPESAIPVIEELEIAEISQLIATLPTSQSTSILSKLVPFRAGKVLQNLSLDMAISFLEILPMSKAELILRMSDRSFIEQVLSEMKSETATYLKRSLTFSKDQVGAHLEPHVLTLSERIKIEKALILVKNDARVVRPHVFIVSESNKLLGYIEAGDLLTNNPEKTIQSLMNPVPHQVFADMSTDDLIGNWHNSFIDLPVVKANGEFIGTVSRTSLAKLKPKKPGVDRSAVKAGNALGDLYLVGLTSLLGGSDINQKP